MTTLSVHRAGPPAMADQPTLVLLHAFPLDASMWEPVTKLLDVPSLAVDLPGFGDSPSQEDLSREHGTPVAPATGISAREVLHVLDDEGLERAVLVGISMGGYVAMAVAEKAPERFAGIGLFDTKAEADGESAIAARLKMATAADGPQGARAAAPMLDSLVGATTKSSRPEVLADVRARLEQAPAAGIAAGQRAMAKRPGRLFALEELGRRGVPALVARGSEDPTSTRENAQTMADALGTEVVTIEGAGHLPVLETPERVAELLTDLARRAAAG